MRILFALILFITALVAEEKFDPAENPAYLTKTMSSFTEPSASLDLKAEYSARLETFTIQEGKELNGSEDKVQIASQDSKLAVIELRRVKSILKNEEKLLVKRHSEKKILERELAYRLTELKRLEKLAENGTATKSNFDRVKFDYDSTALKIDDIESAIQVQQQAIAQSKIAVDKAEEDLRRYNIQGPKGWVLNKRLVEPGTWLNAGEPIAQLVDIRELSIYFRLSEEELKALDLKNLNLRIKRTAQKIPARLHHTDLNFDPVTRKRMLEFRVKAKDISLNSGTEVELSVDVPYPKPAVEIPLEFVFKKFEQQYVKSTTGQEIALIPLRKTKNSIIINKSALPDGIILIKPKS